MNKSIEQSSPATLNRASTSGLAPRLLRWLTSRTVRQAIELRQQVRRLINEQRDLLSPEAIAAMEASSEELKTALDAGADKARLRKHMSSLEEVANERLIPYPNAGVRENIKEVVVAVAVIFSFTTFFLQLTKIPTNSMLPTLYGVTSENHRRDPGFEVPGQLRRLFDYWARGISYYHVTAKASGILEKIEEPRRLLPFIKKQRLLVGGEWYPIWFPPEDLAGLAGLHVGQAFRAGEDIIKLKVVSGDHLLVDRFTYNFRRPRRGEIFVFKTKGIEGLPQGQLYIKRLVALSGEHVRIGDDHHLVINGERLDAATPHFENVYTFGRAPKKNGYFGHVNQTIASRYHRNLAPNFPDENTVYTVGRHAYLAMGDNTMNSSDSRYWGDVPRQNVIGKCWFVYWPFTDRFGWGTR